MEGYNIKIYPSAQDDFRYIAEHLGTLPPGTAALYYDAIAEAFGTLLNTPDAQPLARDTQLRLRGYRTLPVKEYIAFFVINRNTIELRRILFARRQYEGLY